MKGVLNRWRPNQQEDAHEFLLGMFEHINYDLAWNKKRVVIIIIIILAYFIAHH